MSSFRKYLNPLFPIIMHERIDRTDDLQRNKKKKCLNAPPQSREKNDFLGHTGLYKDYK